MNRGKGECDVLARRPQWTGPFFWGVLFAIGVTTEVVALLVIRFWVARFSADPLSLGPVLFGLLLCCLYISAQIMNLLFAVDLTAGLSLSLLAGMLGWLACLVLVICLVLMVGLAVYSVLGVPVRLVYFTWKESAAGGGR